MKLNDVTVMNVPQYKEFSVNDILHFANLNFNIKKYLLEHKYLKDPNREWLWSMINSIIPEDFKNYI